MEAIYSKNMSFLMQEYNLTQNIDLEEEFHISEI